MQCPACDNEATQEAFGDPLCCPSCGAFYAKALAAKQKAAAAEVAPAVTTVQQTRQMKGVVLPGAAQPVVVVDIQMRFWSMVVFMVKWVFASIPAFIIVAVICSVVWGITLGLLSNSSSSLDSRLPKTTDRPASVKPAPPVPPAPKLSPISAIIHDKGFFSREAGHIQDEIAFGLTFTNNTGRVVSAFDGTAVFADVLGNEVFRTTLVVEGYFPIDGEIKRGFTVRYNKFMADQVKFNEMGKERLSVDFRPKKALFKGGEKQEF